MKTFRYSGETIPWANSTGSTITSGSIVVIVAGLLGAIGIAADDILDGMTGALSIDGVHELTALSTDTGSVGDRFYWDSGASRLTSTATGNTFAGKLAEPKLNGDATAKIKLPELIPEGANKAAALTNTSLTDNSTGTPSATLAALSALSTSNTYTDAAVNAKLTVIANAIASLAAQVNDLTTKLRAAGLIG